MHIVSRKPLNEFCSKHANAKVSFDAWFHEVKNESWSAPADIRAKYGHADFIKDNRVIFNIAGNTYRLVAKVEYKFKAVYICFVGTHEEYDKIDPNTVRIK
jgi:mRNA interferase HigB